MLAKVIISMKRFKKLFIFFIIFFFVLITLSINFNSEFKNIIKKASIKIGLIDLKLTSIEKENESLRGVINRIANNNLSSKNLQLNHVSLPFVSRNISGKSTAFLEVVLDKILLVSAYGDIRYLNTNALNEDKIKILKSNLKEIISDKLFYDFLGSYDNSSAVSIKDILVFNNKVYFSYIKKNLNLQNNCYNSAILSADLNFDFLIFSEFFSYDQCIENFYSKQLGGRMAVDEKNNNIFFTIGDFNNKTVNDSEYTRAQDENSIFGKIISIDIDTKDYSIISKGHRNPQGLFYVADKDILLSTEHGPDGGDEINNIEIGGNYGWPISSYGTHYDGYEKFINVAPLHKSHEKFGFIEPIKHFTPSIGISEIIEIPRSFLNQKKRYFLLTSLSGKVGLSIFIISFDDSFQKVITLRKIIIGDRVRDVAYDSANNVFYLILELSNSLGVLSKLEN